MCSFSFVYPSITKCNNSTVLYIYINIHLTYCNENERTDSTRAGGGHDRLRYLPTTRQRNKDEEEETSKNVARQIPKDDRKNDHKIRLPGSSLLCLQPASPCIKNAGKSLKGSRVPFFYTLRKAIADHYQVERRRGGRSFGTFFFRLGLAGPWTFFLNSESGEVGGMCERTCVPLLCYTMVPPLLTLVDLNKRKVLA